ncbi:MAG: O-antigen ligase family protein [Clostridia bacterium]|nr:O-antigen ligase family protein [Clostridia bacterium]
MSTLIFEQKHRREQPALIRRINSVIQSPVGVLLLAIATCVAFAFSKEFEFYLFVIAYAIYVAAFADDLSPLMPLFVFCYIVPSQANNPGKSEESVFYGASGIILLTLVSVAVILVFARIANDKNMGFKRLFTKKRMLAPGMFFLGAAYLVSGVTSAHYSEYALKNIAFALIQFASIFLLYFVFTATVNYNKFNMSYLASIGVLMGLVVAFELVYLYLNGGIISDGVITREHIYTGWGVYNNLGAIIAMAIPFAFYFATRARVATPWILTALVLLAAAILTCSRGTMVFGVPVFIACLVITLLRAESKTEVRIVTAILLVGAAVTAIIFSDKLAELFSKVPGLFETSGDETVIMDNARFDFYANGLEAFKNNPIFGQTFYPVGYDVFDFSEIDKFSSFFPPRWHNTVIQILASCGIVGMVAYLVHRVSTVVLFIKKRGRATTFIAISILALLLMSLVDCHFFNVGPVLFYSIMLAVMECAKKEEF